MLDEFAMVPQLFGSEALENPLTARELTETLKAIAESGLLANLHKDEWIKAVKRDFLPQVPWALRDKLMALLSLLVTENRLVRHPRGTSKPGSEEQWADLALAEHARCNFRAVVTHQLESPTECMLPLERLLDSPQWQERCAQRVIRGPSDVEAALGPFLAYARRLEIIDPYLRPGDADFVDKCGELQCRLRPDTDRSILLHISFAPETDRKFNTVEQLRGRWNDALHDLRVSYRRTKFSLYIWKPTQAAQDSTSPRIHNRYLLTEQAGIKAGDSFKLNANDEWVLLDSAIAHTKRKEYLPNSPHHMLMIDPLFIPDR